MAALPADVSILSATDDDPVVPTGATSAPAAAAKPARRSRAGEKDTRVVDQPGFVLHSYPYKETSLIVDVFSREHGRVALVAKGAKRPHSKLRGVLQTFQPLAVSWSGRAEVRTLIDAEWIGGLLPLEKSALLCGFYLNELLVKMLARDDAHAALFDHYVATLNQLAHDEPPAIVLRKFERALLKETGVIGDWRVCTTSGEQVHADRMYIVDPERGPRPARAADTAPQVSGKTLLDMEQEDYSDPATQMQSKFLMRFLLAHHLHGAPLNTRQILIDLLQL
ncbi:MAG TPA: DNA repair protein RecO [Oxalicibacterium sp.]|nr:DNA repair protein RecO [Oxalicibacterium sp.]